jgi:hypothetical protein
VIYSKVESRYEVSGLVVPGESLTKSMIWLSLSSDLPTEGDGSPLRGKFGKKQRGQGAVRGMVQ